MKTSPAAPRKRARYTLHAGSYSIQLGEKTKIVGIINMTPDSFSQDGCFQNPSKALNQGHRLAEQLIKDGADILDIGGESTRPGSKPVSVAEETKRVIALISKLAKKIKIPISVDTYKTDVAERALDVGATIVNNIKGVKPEKRLLKIVRDYNAAIILMHMRGTPVTMQKNILYKDLMREIHETLRISIENCLETGIKSDRIITDPGIGFGKTVKDNLTIINQLDVLASLKKPILIGTSRKSFIGKILNNSVEDRVIGSVASICASVMRGAHIVRVHDVKAAKEAVTLTDAIMNEKK